MSDSDQRKKSKKILSVKRRSSISTDLKYGGMTAGEAWDQFFRLFITKLKAASKITEGGVVDEVEEKFNQGDDLSDYFSIECDPKTHKPKNHE